MPLFLIYSTPFPSNSSVEFEQVNVFCYSFLLKHFENIREIDYTSTFQLTNTCSKSTLETLEKGVFFYLGFLSRPFTNHRASGEGGGHSLNS